MQITPGTMLVRKIPFQREAVVVFLDYAQHTFTGRERIYVISSYGVMIQCLDSYVDDPQVLSWFRKYYAKV
jgi:hypothetical protein